MSKQSNKNAFNQDFIRAEREQKVVQSVELIQRAQYSLSLAENRFLLYTISKVRPDDTVDKEYVIELKDYMAVCGMQPGTSYTPIKELIVNVFRNMVLAIEDANGVFTITGWYDYIQSAPNDGTIRYKFGSKVAKHLIGLAQYNATATKENRIYYISDELKYMIPFTSRYAYRLYLLLRSYGNNNSWVFKMDVLRDRLDVFRNTLDAKKTLEGIRTNDDSRVPLYPRFFDFRKNVLDPAVEDINRYSNIKCAYRPIYKGRAVVAVQFIFEDKQVRELNQASERGAAVLDRSGEKVTPNKYPVVFYETAEVGDDTTPPSRQATAEEQSDARIAERRDVNLASVRQRIAAHVADAIKNQDVLEDANLGKHANRKRRKKKSQDEENLSADSSDT